ncbi:hypothetical protein FKM82_002651 [Ascaphus truei]
MAPPSIGFPRTSPWRPLLSAFQELVHGAPFYRLSENYSMAPPIGFPRTSPWLSLLSAFRELVHGAPFYRLSEICCSGIYDFPLKSNTCTGSPATSL